MVSFCNGTGTSVAKLSLVALCVLAFLLFTQHHELLRGSLLLHSPAGMRSGPRSQSLHESGAAGAHSNSSAPKRTESVAATSSILQLRLDWTNLSLMLPFSRVMQAHQNNCSLPLGHYRHRSQGMGSDLHVWTQALCNGMERGVRVWTANPWAYVDKGACSNNIGSSARSSMTCYFPRSELQCKEDASRLPDPSQGGNSTLVELYRRPLILRECESIRNRFNLSFPDIRAAGIEFLFSRTSPLVVKEAQRQLEKVFSGIVDRLPSRLITVHIRWGDKEKEMDLLPIQDYIDAVLDLTGRGSEGIGDGSVGIFLATEDPQAAQEFQQAAAAQNWTVYLDAYYQEFQSERLPGYNNNGRMSTQLKGRPGLVAVASLLVAMQANDYVLTSRSNWSKLINELRMNVVDPRCNACTRVIDLTPNSTQW